MQKPLVKFPYGISNFEKVVDHYFVFVEKTHRCIASSGQNSHSYATYHGLHLTRLHKIIE